MSNIAKIFSYSKGAENKKAELQKIGKQIKLEFVGIDHVIDKIIKLVEPWIIMPDAQTRPVIINLWGMTGTGKTSLVRRLSELLKSQLIQIDLGEFADSRNFSVDFYEKYSDMSDRECIILIDEIQNCKTIEFGKDVDRPSIRGLWSLLSDGKIIPDKRITKEYYIEEIEAAINIYTKHKGIPPKQKSDTTPSTTIPIFDPNREIPLDFLDAGPDPDTPPWYIISDWTIGSILKLSNQKCGKTKQDIINMLNKDFMGTAHLLLELVQSIDLQPTLNYQKSVIFIAGNVDEIYRMSKNANPDITPDILHENSKKITVPDVKNSLMNKFRPEQVARLGNNHILYPAFSESNFRDIIKLDLKRIKKYTEEQYDVILHFDQSVEDLIYKEGVFPTQGARPVLSTISTLIESSIPSCLTEIVSQYDQKPLLAPINIKMSLDAKKSIAIFEMSDENDRILNEEKLLLSIETLRTPIYDEEHVMVAVHEAGHTICQIIESGELPTKVCAFSPNVNSAGYMEKKQKECITKEMIYSYITIALGGWAAEKTIFGENKIGIGSANDISNASLEAADAIQNWGLGELPIIIQRQNCTENYGIEYTDNTDSQIKKIIETCLKKAENHIKQYKNLLLDIAGDLLNKPHLLSKDIENILKKHNFELKENDSLIDIFEKEMKNNNIEFSIKY